MMERRKLSLSNASCPRRDFLEHALLGLSGVVLSSPAFAGSTPTFGSSLHIAPFRFDVTPPMGHSLCGGWIKPASAVDDPLEAIGFVLLGSGAPIVVCAVDWTGILNEAHLAWRRALAEAAGTTDDRVTVHCVHQHNAPLVCFDAENYLATQRDLPRVFDRDFHRRCLDAARTAIMAAIPRARAVTHVAHSSARIEQVASNRRVARDPNGRITQMRGSGCKDPALVALPEGIIDPLLRTVAFYDRGTKVVACHYYATHPMSYYGDGRVSSDFCGLARKRQQAAEPDCTQIYFTGCAGNVAAGKYNDGSPQSRANLIERMHRGILAAQKNLRPEPIATVRWRTSEFLPRPNPALASGALRELMTKQNDSVVSRMRPAFKLALMERCERKVPFVAAALHMNDTVLLHLPAEPFVEFQLAAQQSSLGKHVAVAAYGDGGPWYIPLRDEFPAGGYEVDFAFLEPATETALQAAIRDVLA